MTLLSRSLWQSCKEKQTMENTVTIKKKYIYYCIITFVFYSANACSTFFTTYMLDSGLSNTNIGIIQAMNSVFSFLIPPVFGILSDRIQSKRATLLFLFAADIIGFILYPNISGFIPFLIMTSLFSGIRSSAGSINTSLVISETEKYPGSRIFNYGNIRVFGSIAWSVMSLAIKLIMDSLGVTVSGVFYIAAALLAVVLMLFIMSPDRHSEKKTVKRKALSLKELKPERLFKNYYYVTYLFAFILIYLGSCFNETYEANFLKEFSIPSSTLGLICSVRALFEIPSMFMSARIARRFSYEKCIAFSAIVFTFESIALLFVNNLTGILAIAVIHGTVNGMFMGIYTLYLFTLVPKSLCTTAETINSGLTNIVTMLFYLLGGIILDSFGLRNVYYLGIIVSITGFIIFVSTLYIGKSKNIRRYSSDDDSVEQELKGNL